MTSSSEGSSGEDSDRENRDSSTLGPVLISWFLRGIFKFFTFDSTTQSAARGHQKSMTGRCTLCPNKSVSGSFQCTTNFVRHFRKYHCIEFAEYQNNKSCKNVDIGVKRKRNTDYGPANRKKVKSSFFCTGILPKQQQLNIDEQIVNYIIAEARALHTVTRPAFSALIKSLNPRARLMSKFRLRRLISKRFFSFKQSLIKGFKYIDFVCLTADIWSGRKRSFFGVTAHWINSKLERISAAIALRRFKGSHTYDAIAKLLDAVIKDFGLVGKVVSVVTDNGSNFVKAFQVFNEAAADRVDEESETSDNEVPDFDYDTLGESDSSLTEEQAVQARRTAGDLITAKKSASIAEADEDEDSYIDLPEEEEIIILPPHYRCASHTLNLLASNDFEKVIASIPAFKNSYRKVMGKLNALWNANGRSVLASDETFATLGRYLPRPVVSRWNSMFDSLHGLASQNRSKLSELLSKLKIPTITSAEHKFVLEYLSIMSPVAISLDTLQGEKHVYLGCVLPLLVKLRQKLTALQLAMGPEARDLLLTKLESRFGHLMLDDQYILAAISHPKFKLAWVECEANKRLFKQKFESVCGEKGIPLVSPEQKSDEDFLAFNDRKSTGDSECERYLSDKDTNLLMLDKYPTVKSLFIRYNTTLPSSAPVERLFSIAALLLTARRNRLSYTLLEHLLLLKIHGKY